PWRWIIVNGRGRTIGHSIAINVTDQSGKLTMNQCTRLRLQQVRPEQFCDRTDKREVHDRFVPAEPLREVSDILFGKCRLPGKGSGDAHELIDLACKKTPRAKVIVEWIKADRHYGTPYIWLLCSSHRSFAGAAVGISFTRYCPRRRRAADAPHGTAQSL